LAWYIDTSAFLKLIVTERETAPMRDWYRGRGEVFSSQVLRTEAMRAAARLGVDPAVLEAALATVGLILPSPVTYFSAGMIGPVELRSLDAIHLAAALELGPDLEGIATYDRRMAAAADAAGINFVSPGLIA
jgi:predicted nucleic acid-binding protein